MARITPIDKLSRAVSDILEQYGDEVAQNLNAVVAEMGKRGVQALRQQSRSAFPGGSGDYAKGWKANAEQTRLGSAVTLYNADHYSLTHLLEHGHVTRNGTGRIFPPTPAHEHIAPVDEELAEAFEKEVLNRL